MTLLPDWNRSRWNNVQKSAIFVSQPILFFSFAFVLKKGYWGAKNLLVFGSANSGVSLLPEINKGHWETCGKSANFGIHILVSNFFRNEEGLLRACEKSAIVLVRNSGFNFASGLKNDYWERCEKSTSFGSANSGFKFAFGLKKGSSRNVFFF